MSHTPAPWSFREAFASLPTWHIEGGGGRSTLASVYHAKIGAANAAHIVACVNAHDELVAALRGLLRRCEERAMPTVAEDMVPMNEARAALAKVDA